MVSPVGGQAQGGASSDSDSDSDSGSDSDSEWSQVWVAPSPIFGHAPPLDEIGALPVQPRSGRWRWKIVCLDSASACAGNAIYDFTVGYCAVSKPTQQPTPPPSPSPTPPPSAPWGFCSSVSLDGTDAVARAVESLTTGPGHGPGSEAGGSFGWDFALPGPSASHLLDGAALEDAFPHGLPSSMLRLQGGAPAPAPAFATPPGAGASSATIPCPYRFEAHMLSVHLIQFRPASVANDPGAWSTIRESAPSLFFAPEVSV